VVSNECLMQVMAVKQQCLKETQAKPRYSILPQDYIVSI